MHGNHGRRKGGKKSQKWHKHGRRNDMFLKNIQHMRLFGIKRPFVGEMFATVAEAFRRR